ncbi:hypothetical protein V2G26_016578 [Clonostachys chloroleuca]
MYRSLHPESSSAHQIIIINEIISVHYLSTCQPQNTQHTTGPRLAFLALLVSGGIVSLPPHLSECFPRRTHNRTSRQRPVA